MKTRKGLTHGMGILALLTLGLILMVSPSLAQEMGPGQQASGTPTEGPIPRAENPLTDSVLPPGINPQGGGPVPGGPGYVVLNAFDFKPFVQTTTFEYSGSMLQNITPSLAYYLAPVHLPQGATINQIVAYYLDNDSGGGKDVEVDLLQFNDITGGVSVMGFLFPQAHLQASLTAKTPRLQNRSWITPFILMQCRLDCQIRSRLRWRRCGSIMPTR